MRRRWRCPSLRARQWRRPSHSFETLKSLTREVAGPSTRESAKQGGRGPEFASLPAAAEWHFWVRRWAYDHDEPSRVAGAKRSEIGLRLSHGTQDACTRRRYRDTNVAAC